MEPVFLLFYKNFLVDIPWSEDRRGERASRNTPSKVTTNDERPEKRLFVGFTTIPRRS